ncbi:MAG: cell division protein FtsA [Anaerolineales bacterium]|nr:MAG: cell division protein FtsA [Anaerolineales bacterium]
MERSIVSIDVGTTKICTLVAEADEYDSLRIVGVGIAPSRGLRKGVVVNVDEATSAISASVEKAERMSGCKIEGAYVGVAGGHIASVNSRGVVAVSRPERGITQDDIDRALDAAQAIAIPYNREIIHLIPRGFIVDGQDGIRDPLGMVGYRLEVEAHIVTGASASVHNLVKCIQGAGVGVDGLILEPLASGEAVLTSTEQEMGVILADVGGGTTDIAIFIEGSIWHTVVLGTGGNHLTNDIAVGLRTPFTAAEEIKKIYGYALAEHIEDEPIDVFAFGDNARQAVSRRFLAEIIEARTEEVFSLILREIKRSGYDGLLPAGVVLCGGTSELAGIKELGRNILQLPVRVGSPNHLEGLVDVISSPAYATTVGLLLWGLREEAASRPGKEKKGLHHRIGRWLRAFLPG